MKPGQLPQLVNFQVKRVGPLADVNVAVAARFDDENGLAPGDRLGRPGDIGLRAAPDLEQYLTWPRLPARRDRQDADTADQGGVPRHPQLLNSPRLMTSHTRPADRLVPGRRCHVNSGTRSASGPSQARSSSVSGTRPVPLTAAPTSSQLAGSGPPARPSSTRRTRASGAGAGGGADGQVRREVEVVHRGLHGEGGGEVHRPQHVSLRGDRRGAAGPRRPADRRRRLGPHPGEGPRGVGGGRHADETGVRRRPGPGPGPGLPGPRRERGPVRHVVPVGRLRDRGRERHERPLGVEQLVVQHIGHGPAGAAARPHQLSLTQAGHEVSDLPVSGLEGVQHGSMIKLSHWSILPAPGARGRESGPAGGATTARGCCGPEPRDPDRGTADGESVRQKILGAVE